MTLLSLCVQKNLSVVVAHVNYKKRNSSDRDEELVRKCCEMNGIVCEVLVPVYESGNFQSWARDVRYRFYKELCEKYSCDAVLLGHQQDDHLETYLLQLERGSAVSCYGIRREHTIWGMTVILPLLDWTKKETEEYVIKNNVPYGYDETNGTDLYRRNAIRHERVEPADTMQRKIWLEEIENRNRESEELRKTVDAMVPKQPIPWNTETYRKLPEEIRLLVLREYLLVNAIDAYGMSRKYLSHLDCLLNDGKNHREQLEGKLLDICYGEVYLHEKEEPVHCRLDWLRECTHPLFTLTLCGTRTIQAITVTDEDFPLIVRTVQPRDTI